MQVYVSRKFLAFAVTAGAITVGTGLDGCSSGGSSGAAPGASNNDASTGANTNTAASDGGDGGGGPSTPPGAIGDAAAGCANPTVQIDFSPMYSAFIPGSTVHTFAIPAVTDDGNPATWTVSDSTQVSLVTDSFNGLPGVLITVQGVGTGTTGQVTVYATEADGTCGASVLTITTNTEADWQIGNARYNNDVVLTLVRPGGGGDGGFAFGMGDGGGLPLADGGPGGGFPMDGGGRGGFLLSSDGGSYYEEDGGTACTNCHGPTATSGPYKMVSHSPEQTGGFSDSDLVGIFTQGIIPDGGYFDPTVIDTECDGAAACTQAAYLAWHSFHRWTDITPDEYAGVVVYLRSIAPAAQTGTAAAANFGGVGRGGRDGGRGGRGGGGGGDSGGGGGGDSGGSGAADAASE